MPRAGTLVLRFLLVDPGVRGDVRQLVRILHPGFRGAVDRVVDTTGRAVPTAETPASDQTGSAADGEAVDGHQRRVRHPESTGRSPAAAAARPDLLST